MKEKNYRYGMYHVICYDHINAWLSYFILDNETYMKDVSKYISQGNAEVVKVIRQQVLTADDIMNILNPSNWEGGIDDPSKARNAEEYGYECIADRFKNMYLGKD